MITFIKGDATEPQGEGLKVLVHCVNDLGVMGAGIARTIAEKWLPLYQSYRLWVKTSTQNLQGKILWVRVQDDLIVANLVGQEGVGFDDKGNPPIRYESLRKGFSLLEEFGKKTKTSIHMPRIGCGLAGGEWSKVQEILESEIKSTPVFVYDLE